MIQADMNEATPPPRPSARALSQLDQAVLPQDDGGPDRRDAEPDQQPGRDPRHSGDDRRGRVGLLLRHVVPAGPLALARRLLVGIDVERVRGKLPDPSLPEEVGQQADHHADARGGEPGVVAPRRPLGQRAADDRREERAEVHAHVEDRVRAVPPRIPGRVEPPHLRGHVRLEEAVAHDQEGERRVEDRDLLERHAEVADRHRGGADDDRPLVAQVPVREVAPDQGGQVDEARVPLVDGRGVLLRPLEVVDHVQDEQGPHPVVAEALPHLGAEEDHQPLRMPEPLAFTRLGQCLASTMPGLVDRARGSYRAGGVTARNRRAGRVRRERRGAGRGMRPGDQPMTPSRAPTFVKASTARSMWAGSCAAEICARIRSCPFATIG